MAAAVTRFRVVSVLEAISYIALLSFVVNERAFDGSHTGISVMGPTHGMLFLAYVVLCLDVMSKLRWNGATTAKVMVASVIPFAPFYVERWVRTQVPATAKS